MRARLKNHPSSADNPMVLYGNIHNEVALGRLVGPLTTMWTTVVHCSPLSLVPESQPGKWGTIVGLSGPLDGSVSEDSDTDMCPGSYALVDLALALITSLG